MILGKIFCIKPFSSSSSSKVKNTAKRKPCLEDKNAVTLNRPDHAANDAAAAADVFDRLPDDVTIEILSKLPSDSVVTCRRVCKRWSNLTSHHLKKAVPGGAVLLLSNNYPTSKVERNRLDFFLLRKSSLVVSDRIQFDFPWMNPVDAVCIVGSCNGILALLTMYTDKHIFCNLVTHEQVTVPVPNTPLPYITLWSSTFFFDPLAKDYKLIASFRHYVEPEDNQTMAFVYTSKSKQWRELGFVPYGPSGSNLQAVVQNNTLHWMASKTKNGFPSCGSSIITFNMTTEEFGSMPHPGSECSFPQVRHGDMVLLDMGGKVTLCHDIAILIHIWVLEDYVNRYWAKRYTVNLQCIIDGQPKICFGKGYSFSSRPLLFQDGQLYLCGRYGGLFRCDLKKKIVVKIDTGDLEDTNNYGLLSYIPSSVPLKLQL